MKYFALAVIAAAVSALDAEHGSGWSYQQPTSSYHSRPSHSHHSSGHSHSRSGHHAPVHTQTAGYTTAGQFSAHAAPRYPSYGNNYYHQPNHAHNPFEYSRPQIPYVAAKLHAPVYATCSATGSSGNTYVLRFG